jgi:hypothetical protein
MLRRIHNFRNECEKSFVRRKHLKKSDMTVMFLNKLLTIDFNKDMFM